MLWLVTNTSDVPASCSPSPGVTGVPVPWERPECPLTCRPVLRVFSLPALFFLQLYLHTFKAQLKCHLLSEAFLASLRGYYSLLPVYSPSQCFREWWWRLYHHLWFMCLHLQQAGNSLRAGMVMIHACDPCLGARGGSTRVFVSTSGVTQQPMGVNEALLLCTPGSPVPSSPCLQNYEDSVHHFLPLPPRGASADIRGVTACS